MATVAFDFTNAAFFKMGTWSGPSTVAGRSAYQTAINDVEIEFDAKGATITISYYSTTTTGFSYFVDGTLTSPTLTTNAWTDTQTISIPDDGNFHRVIIKKRSGTLYFQATAFITIDGTAPDIRSPGYNTPISLPAVVSSLALANMATSSANGWTYLSGGNVDAAWRFKVADMTGVTSILAWTYNNNNSVEILIDGVVASTFNIPSGNRFNWTTLLSGLSLTGAHEFEVRSRGPNQYPVQLRFVGANAALAQATPFAQNWGGVGDSITNGYFNNSGGYLRKISFLKNWAIWNKAVSGSTISNVVSVQLPAILTAHAANPLNGLLIMSSINDVDVTPIGDFRASWDTFVTNANNSTIPQIVVLKIQISNTKGASAVATYNTEIQAAIAGKSKFIFIDPGTGPGGTYSTTLTTDGLHPNDAGNTLLATNILAALSTSTTAIFRAARRIGFRTFGAGVRR